MLRPRLGSHGLDAGFRFEKPVVRDLVEQTTSTGGLSGLRIVFRVRLSLGFSGFGRRQAGFSKPSVEGGMTQQVGA